MAERKVSEKPRKLHRDAALIDAFGVTNLARELKIKPPSVSKWRHVGMPGYRWDVLELRFPDKFPPDKRLAA